MEPREIKTGMRRMLKENQANEALRLFSALEDKFRLRPDFANLYCRCLVRTGDVSAALEHADKVLDAHPGNADVKRWWEYVQNLKFAESGCVCSPVLSSVSANELGSLSVLKRAWVLGVHGFLSTSSGQLLREQVMGNSSIDNIMLKPEECISGESFLSGEFIVLLGAWSKAFYHWMLDYLPKVVLAERNGYTGRYLIEKGHVLALESLALLNISPARIVEMEHARVQIEELIIPSFQNSFKFHQNGNLFHEFRKSMIEATKCGKVGTEKPVYIARRNPLRPRRVQNEEEVLELLNAYDTQVVEMEQYSLVQQIQLLTACPLLVGPHGAGMIHACFMPRGSTVVEFFHAGYVHPCILPAVEHLKLRYHMLVSRKLRFHPPPPPDSNIEVDIHHLRATLASYSL